MKHCLDCKKPIYKGHWAIKRCPACGRKKRNMESAKRNKANITNCKDPLQLH